MSRQIQIATDPLWKLAGLALLLLSFSFTSWVLGNAATTIDHMADALADFLQTNTPFVQSHARALFAH